MTKKTSLSSKLYTALVFIFLYAPIAVLILFSFNSGKAPLSLKASLFIGTRSFSTMLPHLMLSKTQ